MFGKFETTEYAHLCAFSHNLKEIVKRNNGFVSSRGPHGYHILFNSSEMGLYFHRIRDALAEGQAGQCLTMLLEQRKLSVNSNNHQIWTALIHSMNFSGIDFEHTYGILPSKGAEIEDKLVWDYTFEETIVLSHTLLVVPVMQHYGPLTPKLDLKSPTKKFEHAQPLLAVGMIGDCVKGKFFEQIKQMAEQGNELAKDQIISLLNPERLQQKMRGLVRALLHAREEFGTFGLHVDATLVGSGAFGGSAKDLAQPFVDSLNADDMPFDNFKDEVNFFIYPPPKQPEELTLDTLKYKYSLNATKGLAPEVAGNIVRVVVAGFDPISLTPHGVMNRAFSAEGQLSHATDLLYRITNMPGRFVSVQVPKGLAWESPAAFFSKPQVPNYKDEQAYDTVRFVPESALEKLGALGLEACVPLVATECVPPRVWNGDSFDGWMLSLDGVPVETWQKILAQKRCRLTPRWTTSRPNCTRRRRTRPNFTRQRQTTTGPNWTR